MAMDDLENIIPDFVKPSSHSFRYILLVVGGLMIFVTIVLGCLVRVQLHHGNVVMGAKSTSAQNADVMGMCTTTPCVEVVSRMAENMDPSIDPCQDFYKFSCAGWERRTKFRPYHEDASVLHSVFHDTYRHARGVIEMPLDTNSPSSAKRKIQDLYHSCLNEYTRMGKDGNVMLQMIKDSFKGWYVLDPDGWKDNGWNLQEAIATVIADYAVPVLLSANVAKLWGTSNNVIILNYGGIGMNNLFICTVCDVKKGDPYKDYIREVATALLEDGNVTMDASTKQQRLQQFVDDAYGQEAKIADISL